MGLETQQTWPMPRNPITFRASAGLPAQGAWDTPLEIAIAGIDAITFYITYTRGAANGAFDFQIFTSPYAVDLPVVENWFAQSLYSPGVVNAGADTTSHVQRELVTYQSQGVPAETFVFGPIDLDCTVERIRVRTRESGVTATPGTLHIVAVAV
jgi:hypothetical protein